MDGHFSNSPIIPYRYSGRVQGARVTLESESPLSVVPRTSMAAFDGIGAGPSPAGPTRIGRLLPLSLPVLLCACVGLPTQNPPAPAAPMQWQAAQSVDSLRDSWLGDFADPRLPGLVAEALANNHDLRLAAARLRAAEARARIAGADLLPQAQLGLDASRRGGGNDASGDYYGLQADISWEADLWGRLGNASRAAALDALASEQDYRAARLSLAATVTRNWFRVIEAGLQLQLARHTSDSFGRSLAIIEQRYRRGLDSALDVRLARTDLAAAHANQAARERDLDAARRSLELLLGSYPRGALEVAPALPAMPRAVPAGLPAQLLARRPDLLAAEQRMSAAGQRLDEARKNRLPSLRLTARGGSASDELRQLLDWDNLVWSLLAGLTQPLFQGGRLEAEQLLARARHQEAWEEYAQAVLTAFREVETALSAEARYREQEAALAEASQQAREAERLAESRYRQGLEGIITLLEARRRAFNAESSLLRIARERLENRVDLHLALGGGFETPEEQQP